MTTNDAAMYLMLIVKCCEHADLGVAQDTLKLQHLLIQKGLSNAVSTVVLLSFSFQFWCYNNM